VLKAGTDVDCGGFVQQHGASALAKGHITTVRARPGAVKRP
jgi:hypothetical protein